MTVEIKYLRAADLNIPKEIKVIAILPTGKVEHKDIIYSVFSHIFSNEAVKKRYILIDRENIDKILIEQKLYNNDEFDDKTAVKLGELFGAQGVIIAGFKNLIETENEAKIVITRRYQAADGKFIYKNETLPSIVKTVSFSLDIRMVDVSTGVLLHSETNAYKIVMEKFEDSYPANFVSSNKWNADSISNILRNKDFIQTNLLLEQMSKHYGPAFARKVAPYTVEDSIIFEYIAGDKINSLFFKYLKSDLFDKAQELMISSIEAIKSLKSIKARAKHYYNLGAIYEVIGELSKAKEYYELAIKDNPVKKYLDGLKYIDDKIKDKTKLESQIGEK